MEFLTRGLCGGSPRVGYMRYARGGLIRRGTCYWGNHNMNERLLILVAIHLEHEAVYIPVKVVVSGGGS